MPAPDSVKTVAMDACAVIAALGKGQTDDAKYVQLAIDGAVAGKWTLIASTMLLVEARGVPNADFDPAEDAAVVETLRNPPWKYVELDQITALKARQLAVDHKLRGEDAVHLASAIVGNADVLFTSDGDFPLDKYVEDVWICKPYALDGQEPIYGL